jgi:hypothetical protein
MLTAGLSAPLASAATPQEDEDIAKAEPRAADAVAVRASTGLVLEGSTLLRRCRQRPLGAKHDTWSREPSRGQDG